MINTNKIKVKVFNENNPDQYYVMYLDRYDLYGKGKTVIEAEAKLEEKIKDMIECLSECFLTGNEVRDILNERIKLLKEQLKE